MYTFVFVTFHCLGNRIGWEQGVDHGSTLQWRYAGVLRHPSHSQGRHTILSMCVLNIDVMQMTIQGPHQY